MTPEAAAEAMRAYVEETNRTNHERRASTAGWQTELTRLRKGLKQMLQVIEDGGYTRGMVERMREMEAREDELVALLVAQPQDVPDIHPNVAGIFKHKVERLAETLNHPEDRQEASEAIRALIEKIVLHPGKSGRDARHAPWRTWKTAGFRGLTWPGSRKREHSRSDAHGSVGIGYCGGRI